MAAKSKSTTRKPVSRPKRSGTHPHGRSERLRESAEQFRLAQEALGIVTWIWDVATDRVKWYGDFARMLGLPPRSFSGLFRDYLKLLHPEDAASARATLSDTLKGKRPDYRTAERVVWPDGGIHWLETYGRAEYGLDGRAVRMMGVVKEITERKRQESARERAEKQLARVFEASPDYMVIVRANDGRFIAANPAFERVTGYQSHEIVGRTVSELNIWGIPGERERFTADLQKQGSLQNRAVVLRRRNGELVAGKMSASLIEHEGEKLIVSLMHDVSAVKQLERRARQSESKFAALFEHSPEAISLFRLSDGVRIEANAAWERLSGYSRKQVEGRPAKTASLFRSVEHREAILARIEAEGAISNVEVALVRADGSEMDALLSGVCIELEGEKCVLWNWRDVTIERETAQRARRSEHKFQVLFATTPVGLIVTLPRERKVLEINDAALKILGLKREEAVGAMTTDLVKGVDRELAEQIRARALGGERVSTQLQVERRDGRCIEVLVTAAAVDVDRAPHFILSLLDVTELRRVERERHQADARYRALFETSLDGMVVGTPQNTVIDANPAACAMTGYTPEELAGKHVSQLFHADDLAQQPLRRDLGKRWSVVERRLAPKGGGELHVEIVAGPMPDGNVLAMMRDITERKRNETLLMNIARGVSAQVGDAFFRSLAGHLTRELGADFAFIGELTAGGTRIHPMAFLMDGAIVAQAQHPLPGSMSEQPLAAGRTVIFEKGVRELFPGNADMQKEGVEAYVGTPLYGADGVPLGVLAVGHRAPIARPQFWASMIEIFGARAAAEIERARAEDLVFRTNTFLEQTVQERTSQLEEANRELESYSYSISHDLRQPLNAIGGFAELLREEVAGELSPTARDFVEEIESNSTRMEQMIESLLELSRAGRSTLHKSAVDARQVVDSVLHDLAANGPLTAQVQVGELPPVAGDPVLLRQVWVNLIGNAIKYSGRSQVPRVEIGGKRMDGMVEYSVRDNGVGFDMQHAERLFGAFQRLPSSAGFTGSGIGLAIVERIVQRHGGSIRAESLPGKGATFRFTLPDSPLT